MFGLMLIVPLGIMVLFLITLIMFGIYRIFGGKKSYSQFWG